MRDNEDRRQSSALLAIHCAVSYSDALRSSLGDSRLSSDDHSKAADALEKLLPPKLSDRLGLTHLRKLLARKSRVAYSDQRLSHTEMEDLILAAERFEIWTLKLARQLDLEGWNRDN